MQAFKEENINIEYISGTSSGSIVAALYASGYSPYSILALFNRYCKQLVNFDKKVLLKLMSNVNNPSISSLMKGDLIECVVNNNCSMKKIYNISQVNMPIAIPSVDLNTGNIIYFLNKKVNEKNTDEYECFDKAIYEYEGNIGAIVRGSCSYPAIFDPKMYKEYNLVDGGLRVNTPVSILRKMGADNVILVSFDSEKQDKMKNNNIINVALKSLNIMGYQINEKEMKRADFIISPNLICNNMFDTDKIGMYANIGYYAAKDAIKQISFI